MKLTTVVPSVIIGVLALIGACAGHHSTPASRDCMVLPIVQLQGTSGRFALCRMRRRPLARNAPIPASRVDLSTVSPQRILSLLSVHALEEGV